MSDITPALGDFFFVDKSFPIILHVLKDLVRQCPARNIVGHRKGTPRGLSGLTDIAQHHGLPLSIFVDVNALHEPHVEDASDAVLGHPFKMLQNNAILNRAEELGISTVWHG